MKHSIAVRLVRVAACVRYSSYGSDIIYLERSRIIVAEALSAAQQLARYIPKRLPTRRIHSTFRPRSVVMPKIIRGQLPAQDSMNHKTHE